MKYGVIAGLLAFAVAACSGADQAERGDPLEGVEITGEVNIYSSRHYDTDLALYTDFTKQTGIKVNRIEADADALIERIVREEEYSPADLLITVDAGRLWRAEQAGILAAVDSDTLNDRLPSYLRHPDGLWFGLSTRARVIIYNRQAGVPDGLATYADLADPALKGEICMRSSSSIYNISLLSSVIAHEGAEAAEAWTRGVVANFKRDPQGNDTANIEAVASGECGVSVVNTYYLARLSETDEGKEMLGKIGVIFPNQDTTGTHINISGAGLVKTAKNRENAIRFLEYLTGDTAQSYFANGNHEYPAVQGVEATSAVEALGAFRPDILGADVIGKNQTAAIRIFDRAGWN